MHEENNNFPGLLALKGSNLPSHHSNWREREREGGRERKRNLPPVLWQGRVLGRLVSVSLDHVEAPTPTGLMEGRERERERSMATARCAKRLHLARDALTRSSGFLGPPVGQNRAGWLAAKNKCQ